DPQPVRVVQGYRAGANLQAPRAVGPGQAGDVEQGQRELVVGAAREGPGQLLAADDLVEIAGDLHQRQRRARLPGLQRRAATARPSRPTSTGRTTLPAIAAARPSAPPSRPWSRS